MSYPTIPNITPHISVTLEDTLNLLLASIAMEEIALSHIMNAEGEKIQFALGTLFEKSKHHHCLDDIITVNKEVNATLSNVIRTEIVLQQKLDAVIDLLYTYTPPPCPANIHHCRDHGHGEHNHPSHHTHDHHKREHHNHDHHKHDHHKHDHHKHDHHGKQCHRSPCHSFCSCDDSEE